MGIEMGGEVQCSQAAHSKQITQHPKRSRISRSAQERQLFDNLGNTINEQRRESTKIDEENRGCSS